MTSPQSLSAPTAADFSANERAALIAFAVTLVALWLLPTLLAAARRVPNVGSIAVLNVLLGWLPVWWVICLACSCQHVDRRPRDVPIPTTVAGRGWWPDPIDPRRWRYHDGHRWTDAIHSPNR